MLRPGADIVANYTRAGMVYILLCLGLALPYLVFQQVAAPHRQAAELAAPTAPPAEPDRVENRKFSDVTNAYIPELFAHLRGVRSGWLTLWTNHNELGRPVHHLSGFSPAYPPSWILARFTGDPWRFLTLLSLLHCFLAGGFVLLYCRETALAPLAGLVAACTLAGSPLLMYWLTFPMFLAIWCWAAGALWAVARLAKRPDLLGWSALAFSVYSLLMTAYPQPVVFHAYLLGGYGVYLAVRRWQVAPRHALRFAAISATALFAGVLLALPVYLDLAALATASARAAPDPSFFTAVLPRIASLADAGQWIVLATAPELLGNPVTEGYPFAYDGISVTPVVAFFAVVACLLTPRRTWGWWLAIAIVFLFAFVHPLYVLGVRHMGFHLSRSTPLGSALLPLSIIVAHGVDALVHRPPSPRRSLAVWLAAASVVAILAGGVAFGVARGTGVRWGMAAVVLTVAGLLAGQRRRVRPRLVLAALVIVLAAIAHPLMLRQDPGRIATTSPLVETVRAELPPGARFAIAAPGLPVLPPNLNAPLGLASLHSYNSLSPRRYHALIDALGGQMQTYGRWNAAVAPDYGGAKFWMSNVGLVLSATPLAHENLTELGEQSGVHLHKVVSRMGESLQVPLPPLGRAGPEGLDVGDPRALPARVPAKLLDQGDLLEFELTAAPPSLLILSQKYHPDWEAQVRSDSGWAPAETTPVNGTFQGVLLPAGVRGVRLAFRPFARYAWGAHVFWLLVLVRLGWAAWRKGRRTDAEGAGTE